MLCFCEYERKFFELVKNCFFEAERGRIIAWNLRCEVNVLVSRGVRPGAGQGSAVSLTSSSSSVEESDSVPSSSTKSFPPFPSCSMKELLKGDFLWLGDSTGFASSTLCALCFF